MNLKKWEEDIIRKVNQPYVHACMHACRSNKFHYTIKGKGNPRMLLIRGFFFFLLQLFIDEKKKKKIELMRNL